MVSPPVSSAGRSILVLNGWSCPDSLWQEFASLMGVPVRIFSAHEQMFGSHNWPEQLSSLLASNTEVVGWSLGGIRAIQLAAYCEKNDLAAGQFHIWNAGPAFTSKTNFDLAMSAKEFSKFSDVANDAYALAQKFPFLMTRGSVFQKQDLRQLKKYYDASALPGPDSLKKGLSELNDLNLIKPLLEMKRSLNFVFGEADALIHPAVAKWIQVHCPQHNVRIVPGMGHFPIGAHLDSVLANFLGKLSCGSQIGVRGV